MKEKPWDLDLPKYNTIQENKKMSVGSLHRGHPMYFDDKTKEWRYCDDDTFVKDHERSCGFCNKPNTPEGHDPCLGTLDGVMNACCGHGRIKDAYIQYEGGKLLHGEDAIYAFLSMKESHK